MKEGIVRWFNAEKGYGFIGAEGMDYFVHYREINAPGFKVLKTDDRVSFEPSRSEKGLVATQVNINV